MKKPSFETALEALGDLSKPFPEKYLPLFSDLTPAEVSALAAQWPGLPHNRKHQLLDSLVKLYAKDNLVSFETLAASLLSDPDEQIRLQALLLLADCENAQILPHLIRLAENDPFPEVRIRTASVLGNFVELGELDEIPRKSLQKVEECLLRMSNAEWPEVQRAALEAAGSSSRPEVETLIHSAYQLSEPKWVAASLIAMGHSANERWEELILSKLSDYNADIRSSAVQAAGELRLEVARPILLGLLEDEEDDEIFAHAIWSLSQIGGDNVRLTIETLLDQAEEEDIIAYLEEALDNLDFTEQLNGFNMLSIDPDDELDVDNSK